MMGYDWALCARRRAPRMEYLPLDCDHHHLDSKGSDDDDGDDDDDDDDDDIE